MIICRISVFHFSFLPDVIACWNIFIIAASRSWPDHLSCLPFHSSISCRLSLQLWSFWQLIWPVIFIRWNLNMLTFHQRLWALFKCPAAAGFSLCISGRGRGYCSVSSVEREDQLPHSAFLDNRSGRDLLLVTAEGKWQFQLSTSLQQYPPGGTELMEEHLWHEGAWWESWPPVEMRKVPCYHS